MNSDLTLKCNFYPLVIVAGTCLFFVGMISFYAMSETPEVGIVLGMVMGPPALFLFCIGASLMSVKVQVLRSLDPIQLAFRLPRAGSAPLLPTMVHPRKLALSELYRVDVMLRSNAAATGGFERLVHLRTDSGDFYFNSQWFSKWQEFEDFVQLQGIHMLVGSVDDVMERIAELPPRDIPETKSVESEPVEADRPILASPAPVRAFSLSELFLRGFGWLMFAVLTVILLLGALVALFGEPSDQRGGWIAVFIAAMGLGSIKMLTSFRRAK